MLTQRKMMILSLFLFLSAILPGTGWSSPAEVRFSKGQTVYVAAYSNVYSGPRKNPFQLATMLSIRNTDMSNAIRVTSIDYYNNDGRLVRRYLDRPQIIAPLGTTHIYLEEKDASGGFGANFIVRWNADKLINAPIIECLMIGATGGQGISFVSPGQEIRE